MSAGRLSSAGFPTNLAVIMKSAEDIESYLLRMGVAYETIKPGIWLVKMDGSSLIVSIAGPVVAFRLKVMDVPRAGREELYRTLLELNTTDMVHGAFGLEGDTVVVIHALELENLDFNEFQAVVDDMSMAVAKHHTNLARFARRSAANAAERRRKDITMGIFSRLGTLIKSNLNDLISKAEDPEKMLNQVLARHAEAARRGQEAGRGRDRRREAAAEAVRRARPRARKEWERKAMLAVRAGDDDLAKEALVRKKEHEELADAVPAAVAAAEGRRREAQGRAAPRSTTRSRRRSARRTSSSRARSAPRRRSRSRTTMRGLSDTSAFDTFDRMARRSTRSRPRPRRARARRRAVGRHARVEVQEARGIRRGADLALAELKAKMGLGPAPEQAALPEVKTDGGKP